MRLLDRVGGVVALRLLAAGRRRKPLPDDPRKIGVIIPPAIGDTIIGSGALAALNDRYPRSELIFFHGRNNASAAGMMAVSMTRIQCEFTKPLDMIKLLRRQKLDMVVDLTSWTKVSALYARLAAPVAVGFDLPGQFRGQAFDIAVQHRPGAHEIDNYAAVAALFSERPYRTYIVTKCFTKPEGVSLDRLVLCHSVAGGARAADKAWPAEHWAELARRLAAKGWQVGFTGTSADAGSVEKILKAAGLPPARAVSLCGLLSLAQLGELLRCARLLITIDTGVLHLAAAVDAEILALHGPTRSACWGARNAGATNLNSDHPEAGYIRYGYESHPLGHETMRAHTVDDVSRAALIKLERPRRGGAPEQRRFSLDHGLAERTA